MYRKKSKGWYKHKFENQERIEEVLGNQNKYVKVKLK